jgi:putative transposase
MSRRLDDVRLAVMMLDGMEVAERTPRGRARDDDRGREDPARGLGGLDRERDARPHPARRLGRSRPRPTQAILFVIDGGKALRRAIRDVFGEHALVHRCHRHKERNIADLLPERDGEVVRGRTRAAWSLTDPELARQRLELLEGELDRSWPDAAASLRAGMDETLTLMRLGISGQLAKTLSSTNPCESMIEIVRSTHATSSAGARGK